MTSFNKSATGSSLNCVHRGISRLRAEELLLTAKQDGSYLVRESETCPGGYTICILYENRVHQYRIIPDAEGKLGIQGEGGVLSRKYNDLNHLVSEYVQRGTKNGMAGPLLYPVLVDDEDEDDLLDEEKVEDEADSVHLERLHPPTDLESGLRDSVVDGNEAQSGISEFLYQYFLQRFRSLNLSRCDGPFISVLQNYIDNGASQDAQLLSSGGDNLPQLRHVIDEAAKDIDRHLENLMVKIDICRQLFGPITTTPLVVAEKGQTHKPDMANVFERMSRCKSAVQNLEKKAKLKFNDLSVMWKEGGVQVLDSMRQPLGRVPAKPIIPPTSFEAKVVSRGTQAKIKLTVDIQAGKLMAIKPNKDVLNERNMFTHDRIEQLILSTSNNCRLDVKVSGLGLKTYLFEDIRQRENFCQLLQQLKNMHSIHPEVKKISFFVGTWNMGDEMPVYSLLQWIKSDGLGKRRNSTMAMIPHDIYVFGTQESSLSDKEWTNRLKILLIETFGEEFYQVAISTLWGIRLVIFAKTEHRNKISHVQQSTVKTGIANALGNKGAVGVSFNFSRTSFCFICAHLTSGHEKNKRRNQNVRDILKGLDLVPKKIGPFDITKHFHHLFFFGDLNYRIEELDSSVIIKKIKESNNYNFLLEYDQLTRMQKRKEAFVDFYEENIAFPPTYRFKKGTRDTYVWQKFKATGIRINAPSFCDRVLWHSYPETSIVNTSYGCTDRICSSDHKPVFATFDVGVTTQFTSAKGGSALSGDMKIIFEEISAEIKTSRQDSFKLEFHSTCLETPVVTKQNNQSDPKKEYCCPRWTATQLPQLQPIFDDRDYLEDQHLLVAVKTSDGLEYYGECVLALKSMFAIKPQKFCCSLTHLGEETGYIRGLMHVKANDDSPSALQNQKSRKMYDLIYTDVEFLREESDPSIIYQEGPLITPQQQPQPQALPKVKSTDRPVAGADTLPGGACGAASAGISAALAASLASSCMTHFQEGALHPAKAVADISRLDSNVYEDVAERGLPGLPPRKGRPGLPPLPVVPEPVVGPPGTDASVTSAVSRGGGGSSRRTNVVSDPSASIKVATGNTVPARERSSVAATTNYVNVDTPVVRERPPLPLPDIMASTERSAQATEPQMPSRSIPGSIKEWLSSIGLPQYTPIFINNGWDQLKFLLTDMTADDLDGLNIANSEHKKCILHSIERLRRR